MPLIGRNTVTGNYIKCSALTPDGSTTTFTLTNSVTGDNVYPGNQNSLLVSVSGVIQSPGDAFTINNNQIIFSAAPESEDTIDFIVVLGDLVAIGTPSDGTVTTVKMADTSVTDAKLHTTLDLSSKTITLPNTSVTNAQLENSSITINGSAVSLGGSVTVGETKPTISSISPDTIGNDATDITITGTNFTSIPTVTLLNPSTGIYYSVNSVTFNNSTSLTVNATLSVDANYKIRIENPDGNAVLSSTSLLTVSDAPTWTTSAGSLGTFAGDTSGTLATVAATSDSSITYSETTNVLTNASLANCSLNSSTGAITTTDFGGSSTTATTYTFTLRATDAEGQTVDREFSLSSVYGASGGANFN
jgi:hypothetical protein